MGASRPVSALGEGTAAMVDRQTTTKGAVRQLGSRVLATLGRQTWLDRPSYRFEHVLTFVFSACGGAGQGISNALHGTWLGHPLHPALTSLPTGAGAATVALDAASVIPGYRESLRDASRAALGVGILGSLCALATGLTDWQHTHEQSRRVGVVHGALNLAATGLYVMSCGSVSTAGTFGPRASAHSGIASRSQAVI